MRRFFVDTSAVLGGELVISSPEDIRHISKVLRLAPGNFLDVSDSAAYEYRVEILEMDQDQVVCRIHDKQSFSKEPKTQVTLYQGIPKQAKMETIVQKCVELGIFRIVPVFTDRTVVVEKDNFGKKLDRWQKVSAEAVKQCRRGLIPEVSPAIRFSRMEEEISQEGAYDLTLFLYENEEQTTIKQALSELVRKKHQDGSPHKPKAWLPKESKAGFQKESEVESQKDFPEEPKGMAPWRIALLIGPEGGFSDEEAERLKASHHTQCATLGKTILRTETAGPAALAMVMYELEL